MPNRPGNDDRTTAGGINDRANQRDNANDVTRNNGQGSSTRTRSNRGFASMDRGKQREIASKGGKAAHAKGTAHEFDSSEAREAGRKGGVAVSRNRDHMAAIGRRGGEARGSRAAALQGRPTPRASGARSRAASRTPGPARQAANARWRSTVRTKAWPPTRSALAAVRAPSAANAGRRAPTTPTHGTIATRRSAIAEPMRASGPALQDL